MPLATIMHKNAYRYGRAQDSEDDLQHRDLSNTMLPQAQSPRTQPLPYRKWCMHSQQSWHARVDTGTHCCRVASRRTCTRCLWRNRFFARQRALAAAIVGSSVASLSAKTSCSRRAWLLGDMLSVELPTSGPMWSPASQAAKLRAGPLSFAVLCQQDTLVQPSRPHFCIVPILHAIEKSIPGSGVSMS